MDEDSKFSFITKPVFAFNVVSSEFKELLNASHDHQILNSKPFKQKKIEKIFEDINSKIDNLQTRHVGILLLDTFLPQCYDEIFQTHAVRWMTECIDLVMAEAHSVSAVLDAYKVLNSLFEYSGKFKSLRGIVSTKVVNHFLDHMLTEHGVTQTQKFYILNCLKSLLPYHYKAESINAKKVEIVNFLLETVDCTDSSMVSVAGQCMCYLGSKGFLHLFNRLCRTAHALLDKLLTKVMEPNSITELPEAFVLQRSNTRTKNPLLANSCYARRFVNVLNLMEGMLMSDSRFCKVVSVSHVMNIISRVLSINCKNIRRGRGTVEHYTLLSVLPTLHVSAFDFLRSFVTSYDGLLEYGGVFCQMVVDALTWTNEHYEAGNIRPFGRVRKAACLFLETWVVRAKAASCVELYAEKLFSLLLKDIVQEQKTVELLDKEVSGDNSKPMTKLLLLNPQANAETCAAALSLLCAVIEASGSRVKKHHHIKLQETIVGLLLKVQCRNLEYFPLPFSAPACRLQLYRVLLALTLHPHGDWPAPVQFALTLFPYGQCDPCNEVASFCLLATAAARQVVNPSRSNAQFPISTENIGKSIQVLENAPTPLEGSELVTPSSDTSLTGMEVSTPVSNSGQKAKKSSSPAVKRKKTVPELQKEEVNGVETDSDSSVAEQMEDSVVSSDRVAVKCISSATKKKKRASANGLGEVNGKIGKQKKKKPKQSLESSVTDGDISLSSEPPLKKKRCMSESSVGSLDLSARNNILRQSVDNWDVVDIPQKEKKKKKKRKQKKKMQTDEGSVDVEPVNDIEQRSSATEIIRNGKKLLSSGNSWNVSDSLIQKASPTKSAKKIVSHSGDCLVQKQSKRRLGEGENKSVDVPALRERKSRDKPIRENKEDKSIVTEKEQVCGVGKENSEQRKEEAEIIGDAMNKVISSSRSSAADVPPLANHSSADEKESSKEDSPKKKSHSLAEGVDEISDSVGAAKEKFQRDKPQTSFRDSETTAESATNICGDEGRLDCEEKSPEDVPSSIQTPETVSQDKDTVTIEEIPIHEVEPGEEKPKDTSANPSPYANTPVVDLADSDNSCSIISLDSDGKEEQARGVLSDVKESAVNTSFEDGQDPDASTGMDAVVESPSVSLEGTETEAAECGASGSSEQLNRKGNDSKRDSDTDEEDILTTFVDIVSTDSK